jgi:hypothetical protein
VLLDQVWDVNKLNGCSKTFRSVLTKLTSTTGEGDIANVLSARQHQFSTQEINEQCLNTLIKILGDITMCNHVRQFLNSHTTHRHLTNIVI